MKKDLNYYMNLNYSTEFKKITEDDGEVYYRVTIPKLPGLIAYGDTLEEAVSELDDAKTAWFSSCLRRNVKIPEPTNKNYSGKLLVRMPKSLHAQLAEEENVSLNSFIVSKLAQG
ncbi:toxin-antitoxin system HicB family antitoxin [Lactobacillus crispatus]|jgi:predicted RNase H-like HicB family nuclease|uniref:toxin-antitoxin system HicB family antitoxin n=1 Tax=Lactobacillus crispatus TaxID=47770 RepID=UPI001E4299CD|nr:toxin-antitoxin system HicB family antitoxin [Lactobacillus crispatus]MCH4004911.1 type II toxin-antitoxin system HicB family antitoxin [Lactobacillus crispatus]MCI1335601.1 type II toxin-antitoxin system HicB family antitoxin [Lactobacillus crispatus]MCI1364794.1 type II toxin-antitoxin system HicB family antitoxin [Lactobacillus crispatus]MCI1493063.1 type II toxin-antitoxin system HicB family antitoxin [Lactobacillus crispatus]MCI1524070.1 type II toxin-antitoxin system HicB family antit